MSNLAITSKTEDASNDAQHADFEVRDVLGEVEEGVGLSLSGGCFRAMLFHLGSLIRLNELGLPPTIARPQGLGNVDRAF